MLGVASILTGSASAEDYAIIDQTIQTSFEPVAVTALVYDGNRVRQYEADYVPVPTGSGSEKLYRVAAVLPFFSQTLPPGQKISVSFFLVSVDGDFAATVVQEWTNEALVANTRRRADLEKELEEAKLELPKQRARNDALEQELERAKDRASNMAEVEDIIGLKSALDQLKVSDTSAEIELGRLRELVKSGKNLPPPENAVQVRSELSKQLQEVVLATANTEHIRSSRRQNASTSYFHKLELAREAEGVDIRGLASQVLDLRQKRKELEARLGVTAAQLAGEAQGVTSDPSDENSPGGEF